MTVRQREYLMKYGLPETSFWRRIMTEKFMAQLDNCKSDEARRLILGVKTPEEDYRG